MIILDAFLEECNMSEASDLFEDSDDSLLDPDYVDDVVDGLLSSNDFDSYFTGGQVHHKRRSLRTLAHLATAAPDNGNAVLELCSGVRRIIQWEGFQ